MEIGFIGLGRMGSNMVRRLLAAGHRVVAYDRSPSAVTEVAERGAIAAGSLPELVAELRTPRVVWLMVPAGQPVTDTVQMLASFLAAGDLVVDGGNSDFRDSLEHAATLADRGIHFVDCGTSGGLWGLTVGFCLMVGGRKEDFQRIEPLLQALAAPEGYAHVGPVGAGHYVKMVHNGIEYALLQSYAEGFELLRAADFEVDLAQITHLWSHGSVIRSWLLELAEAAFREDPTLEGIKGYVEDTGYGRATVREAVSRAVPLPVITLALMARFRSRQEDSFAAKVIAALREGFGGHRVVHR
jgi:6-phosphogluconate dehydrogenase